MVVSVRTPLVSYTNGNDLRVSQFYGYPDPEPDDDLALADVVRILGEKAKDKPSKDSPKTKLEKPAKPAVSTPKVVVPPPAPKRLVLGQRADK